MISGVTGWGIYVELPNTIEGMIALNQLNDDFYEFDDKNMLVYGKRTKKTYRLGDRVLVYVAKVDRMMNTIDFMFDYPNGEEELMDLAYRTDFGLQNIARESGKSMEYRDKITNETFVPHVIEAFDNK